MNTTLLKEHSNKIVAVALVCVGILFFFGGDAIWAEDASPSSVAAYSPPPRESTDQVIASINSQVSAAIRQVASPVVGVHDNADTPGVTLVDEKGEVVFDSSKVSRAVERTMPVAGGHVATRYQGDDFEIVALITGQESVGSLDSNTWIACSWFKDGEYVGFAHEPGATPNPPLSDLPKFFYDRITRMGSTCHDLQR